MVIDRLGAKDAPTSVDIAHDFMMKLRECTGCDGYEDGVCDFCFKYHQAKERLKRGENNGNFR